LHPTGLDGDRLGARHHAPGGVVTVETMIRKTMVTKTMVNGW
jgi:hypothetical protein